ncbi:MAG: 5-formyltetrahydrofolate cyclo-ligase [Halioglobus sp.]
MSKQQLRTLLRERRCQLDTIEQQSAASRIAQYALALPEWPSATKIALYHPVNSEISGDHIASEALSQGKTLYLPVIGPGNTMSFAQWGNNTRLQENRFGIAEPTAKSPRCPASELDILFMPLLGWDRKGNRLGMGAGFYDRCLEGVSGPLLVGLAYSVQEIGNISSEPWDIALDRVLTENGTQVCSGGAIRSQEPPIAG